MSSPAHRSSVSLASCLALILSILPLVAADPPPLLPFLKIGLTYHLTSATPTLPKKVKILGDPVGGLWIPVEYEGIPGGVWSAKEGEGLTDAPKMVKTRMYINFATVSGVRLAEEAPQPAPDKK